MTDKKKSCAYCHAYLFEDDDIVYCPDCGAAHHRECWLEINRCANENNHGKQQEITDNKAKTIKCNYCETENNEDAMFCQKCGISLNNTIDNQNYYDDYKNNENADTIDGVYTSTVSSYIRVNYQKYVEDFKSIDQKYQKKKKLSSCIKWNWSAFIFGYLWLFYRKCHKPAWVVFFISVVSTILQTPLLAVTMNVMYDIIGVPSNQVAVTNLYNTINANIIEIYSSLYKEISPPFIIMFVISILLTIIIHIIIGMFGVNIYKNNAINKIKTIEQSDIIDSKQQIIASSGGVNIFMVCIAWYLMNLISNYLMLYML